MGRNSTLPHSSAAVRSTASRSTGVRQAGRISVASLRFLGNALRIPLVCLGTREAYLALRTDEAADYQPPSIRRRLFERELR